MTTNTSNTHIRIRRSTANATPTLLQAGELAYSYLSNTAFIGTSDGTGVLKLGGAAYTAIIDSATDLATANTLVLRDINGSFSANVVDADTVQATNLYGALSTATGVESGTWGSATQVPVLDIAANGLITGVTTANISTTLSFTDGDVVESLNLVDGALSVLGENGITTVATANTITVGVDDSIMRSNTEGGPQHVSTDVLISGNLTVQGTTTYVQTSINQSDDSMIELAANNTVGDVLDIGFYGKHEGADGTVVTGLVRNAGTSDFYLFDNIALGDQENLTSNIITQGALAANGASLYSYKFLATQSLGGTEGGYSFSGNEGGLDTGMFSPTDGQLQFYSNAVKSGEINPDNDGTSFGFGSAATGQGYRAIALGYEAGVTTQGNFATAVGLHAGQNSQGTAAVAVGHSAGQDTQGQDAVAIGSHAGQNTQGYMATAIGYRAGYGDDSGQGQYAVAVGAYAGRLSQVEYSIAINASGNNLNPTESGLYIDPIRANNAVGGNVTTYNTTTKEVVYTDVVINNSGITLANGTNITDADAGLYVDSLREDGTSSDIVYYNTTTKELTYGTLADIRADVLSNGEFAWTISGTDGSLTSNVGTQIAASANSVVIGPWDTVDVTNGNSGRVALGIYAGSITQASDAIAIGNSAGFNNQSQGAVAIGYGAGNIAQGFKSVAVGQGAGNNNQGGWSTAVGLNAGYDTQGTSSVAIGHRAGGTTQGGHSVAVGVNAGQNSQGVYATALGHRAGYGGTTPQGDYSLALGYGAGVDSQAAYSIALNASTDALNPVNSGLYINPIRYVETQDVTYDGIAFYNSSTKEMTYSYILDGGDF